MKIAIYGIIGPLILSACTFAPGVQGSFQEPGKVEIFTSGPEDAPEGTCWGRDQTPAVVETVTVQVVVSPEVRDDNGTLISPPVYRTETKQRIISDRDDVWFEAPCRDVFTPEFVGTLQRALKLRGFYAGPITGVIDPVTENAIRIFQKDQGLNSPFLSMIAARKLGIIAYSRDDISTF